MLMMYESFILTFLLLCFLLCSLPKILKEIAREDKEKKNKHLRRTIAKQDVLKIRPPRLGKHKYDIFLQYLSLTIAHSYQLCLLF